MIVGGRDEVASVAVRSVAVNSDNGPALGDELVQVCDGIRIVRLGRVGHAFVEFAREVGLRVLVLERGFLVICRVAAGDHRAM